MFILFAERKVGEQHGPAAQGVLAAVQTLREMNADNLRKVPADAPTAFIKPRWKPLVITPEGLDRKFYEICALSELKNALRSGDIWVRARGSSATSTTTCCRPRSSPHSSASRPCPGDQPEQRPVPRKSVCSCWTSSWPPSPAGQGQRAARCHPHRVRAEKSPLDAAVPDRAQALIDQTSQLLPRIKITELLMDVDDWTGFSRHFTHLKDGAEAKDRTLLLSAILGDAITSG